MLEYLHYILGLRKLLNSFIWKVFRLARKNVGLLIFFNKKKLEISDLFVFKDLENQG